MIKSKVSNKRYPTICATISKFEIENDPLDTVYKVENFNRSRAYLIKRSELVDHINNDDIRYRRADNGTLVVIEFGKFGYSKYFTPYKNS